MKKLLFLSLIIPLVGLSQERQQKLNLRNYGSVSPNMAPSYNFRQPIQEMPRNNEYRQKQIQRDNNRYRPGSNIPNNNYFFYDPFWDGGWGWNRWNAWGAPMWGWNYWQPSWYYDRWGFRQPARVYVYEDGKRDTIKGIRPHFRVGLGVGNDKNYSFWFTAGNKTYFVGEFSKRFANDKSTFYNNLTMDEVIPWNDKRLQDVNKNWTIYAGVGQKINKFGAQVLIGYGQDVVNYQFFDEYRVLSNNGRYSFRDYKNDFFTIKGGILYDFKNSTIKADYDPIRNVTNVGLGLLF